MYPGTKHYVLTLIFVSWPPTLYPDTQHIYPATLHCIQDAQHYILPKLITILGVQHCIVLHAALYPRCLTVDSNSLVDWVQVWMRSDCGHWDNKTLVSAESSMEQPSVYLRPTSLMMETWDDSTTMIKGWRKRSNVSSVSLEHLLCSLKHHMVSKWRQSFHSCLCYVLHFDW